MAELAEILHWGEDGDAAKGVEGEKVVVASEDDVGAAVDGEFEELVVFGVTAGADDRVRLDDLR